MNEQDGGWPPPSSFDGYFANGPKLAAPPLPAPRLPSTRRSWRRQPALLVVVVLAATVLGLVARTHHHRQPPAASDGMLSVATHRPPQRDVIQPTRILDAPAPRPGTGGYTFLDQRDGSPVAWDPCEPIHLVVRAQGQIPGGPQLIDQAIAEVSKDTGLYFVDNGTTNEAPSTTREAYEPDRYGRVWAPVLIAWSNPEEYPGLAGDVVGLAGPIASSGGADARLVSGEVIFDAPQLAQIEAHSGGTTYVYDVLLHELGHLVGLGHVNDPAEIMNPVEQRALSGYGPGDLRGLAAVGNGRCFTKV